MTNLAIVAFAGLLVFVRRDLLTVLATALAHRCAVQAERSSPAMQRR
jgi:hypothetical protein